ncbi:MULTISPECIES: hypothetical protein [Pseudomonadota]|uniref:hypothetical protein n=1 Tax=Pseudomonadota TaxID=1224 RepID=UPI002630087E|nr:MULTISPECIES: hypothetical protein [Pseudomonadota]
MTAMENFIGHTQLQEEYEVCISKGLVPYVRSSPGIGKSDSAKKFAAKHNLELIDIRLSQCTPEDLQGYPMREGDKAVFTPFNIFPLEGEPLPKGKNGWLLLLDELSSANKAVQAAAYKIILDRQVGSFNLHPNCGMIACGNLITDKAVVHKMSTALQSRLVHYQLQITVDEWTEWALEHNIDHRISAFVNFDNNMLMNFNPDHEDHTFACPRTWEFLNRTMNNITVDRSAHQPRICGTIGSGAGMEFISFCEVYNDLPKWDHIIDPKINEALTPPPEPTAKFAVISWIGAEVEKKDVENVLPYIQKFGGEFQMLFCRHILRRLPNMDRESEEFRKFSMKIISKANRL